MCSVELINCENGGVLHRKIEKYKLLEFDGLYETEEAYGLYA